MVLDEGKKFNPKMSLLASYSYKQPPFPLSPFASIFWLETWDEPNPKHIPKIFHAYLQNDKGRCEN